jgi:pyrimidine operon attenuation protein/uracil phosphoribosyltransferase
MPVIGMTEIPTEITGRRVVIVDDVLFTGRTIRAALNELSDFGRPARIELCVLVDRGGRQLPIQADYVGIRVAADERDLVEVRVPELDDESSVTLVEGREEE